MHFQMFLAFASCSLLSYSNAQSIAAFYSSKGPAVISLNSLSGNFSYNVYTQKGFSSMKSFAPTIPPRTGTSIACVGYNNPSSIYGSIFYQTANNTIAQQFFKCAYSSGNCVNYGGYFISLDVTTPVKSGTGLAAALLSADFGYRVTYQDIRGSVRQLSYSNTAQNFITPWADGVLTTNTTILNGSALSMTYVPSLNDTVPAQQTIFQRSGDQILQMVNSQTTFINRTQTWVPAPAIDKLQNWNSTTGTFATVIYNAWMLLFYVDTNRQVQYVRSTDAGQTWQTQPLADPSSLPPADVPDAPVAAATSLNTSSDNSVSVFYISGGVMIQATMTNYTWQPYAVVDAATSANGTTSITNTTVSYQPPVKQNDNKEIKIGASTGASVGFLVIVAIIVWYLSPKTPTISDNSQSSIKNWKEGDYDFSFNGKAELHGNPKETFELDHDPECRLLHQLQLYRMYELRGEIPVELQNSEAPRPELDHTLCKCELDASVLCELPTSYEKEEIMNSTKNSEKSKEKELMVQVKEIVEEVKQLPTWSWDILRRLREEQEIGSQELDLEEGREKQKAREKG